MLGPMTRWASVGLGRWAGPPRGGCAGLPAGHLLPAPGDPNTAPRRQRSSTGRPSRPATTPRGTASPSSGPGTRWPTATRTRPSTSPTGSRHADAGARGRDRPRGGPRGARPCRHAAAHGRRHDRRLQRRRLLRARRRAARLHGQPAGGARLLAQAGARGRPAGRGDPARHGRSDAAPDPGRSAPRHGAAPVRSQEGEGGALDTRPSLRTG